MSRLPATRDGQASRVPATPVADVSTVELLELLVGSHQCVDLTLDDTRSTLLTAMKPRNSLDGPRVRRATGPVVAGRPSPTMCER